MGWSKTLEGVVKKVEPGNIRGQYIATIDLKEYTLTHDIIEGTIELRAGEKVEIYISDELPNDIDSYDFCGHGYLVESEERIGKTILSLWGIIFKFEPAIGLEENRKYYICLRRSES